MIVVKVGGGVGMDYATQWSLAPRSTPTPWRAIVSTHDRDDRARDQPCRDR